MFLLKKLRRASVFDVIISDEIENFIANNIIESKYEVGNIVESAITFITRKCNDICMVKKSTGELIYRTTNYFYITSDNTKQMLMDTPLEVTQKSWERLHKIGLENYVFNDNGNENIL